MNDEPQWLTREAAGHLMMVSPKTLDRWAREGRIQRYKLSGTKSVRFKRAELEALIVADPSLVREAQVEQDD